MQKIVNEKGTFEVHELCGHGFWSENNQRYYEKETQWLVREAFQEWINDKRNWPGLHEQLKIVGAAPTAGTRCMLWEVGRKVIGKDPENYAQEIGDCVSWGARNAICYIQFFPMANGKRATWKDVFTPYLYGCGRVFIGNSQLGSQDGSIGSWQAQACMKYGTVALDEKTSSGASLPPYSGSVARQWGNRPGPSKDWQNVGVEHLVKSTAPVRTWEEYCQAISNGYAVTIASNVGFDMTVRSDGFHHYSTTWGHQMCGIGFDDDPGDPYGCIRNSWSDVHGHIKDFKTGETWPVGTLRVRKKDIETMLRADDSFAYSTFDGFPAQELPRELFNPW